MKKLLTSKYWWIPALVILAAVNYFASFIHSRMDLTAEKRYTISEPTKKLLRNLNAPVDITVFLDGDLPAGFKKLAGSTHDMMQEFKEIAHGNITYRFATPGNGLPDSAKYAFQDSLQRMGLHPMNIRAQVKEGEGQEQRLVYPGALISYKGQVTTVDFLQGQSSVNGINSLNNAEALLEYKLASSIERLTRDTVPLVGYLTGNGEPLTYNVSGLIENTLRKNYEARLFPIDSFPAIPNAFDALVVVKPTVAFTDAQKLKIDQYVMHGGKIIWLIDELYAEMDSLMRVQNDFIAFDRGLNLEDILFKYGVRINPDLVQDLNCDKYPIVVGSMGGKPQMDLLQWPYFPLLSCYSNHPIAKNLDYVVSQFPNSIDTIKAAGITKTILLATSPESRTLNSPARVSLHSIQTEADLRTFDKANIPVAVLLEGTFTSLYNNRVSQEDKANMDAIGRPFAATSPHTKMIVVSDGDIALNAVSQTEGPLPMGMNPFTKYQYANADFLANCLEYLVSNSNILEARTKDYTLRLLNKKKIEADKTQWQVINLVVPVILVILFGLIYQRSVKYRFGRK